MRAHRQSIGTTGRLSRRGRRLAGASLALTVPLVLTAMSASPALADPYHNSYMSNPYCLSVPGVPGDCTGFVVGSGVTVRMICFEGGPQALGSGKWFEITVLSGNGYGMTGDVPANAVGNQWNSSPHC
jgi:hypothetical protein